jgi:pyruvate,water dikinase
VQKLVPADVAGVLFTANPMTGARDELMINAAWGLGEAIVGGQVTPDTLRIHKQTGTIIHQEIATKEVMTVRLPQGTQEEPVPAAKRQQAALQSSQAAELARLGAQIEELYGRPMDIEWALAEGRLFLLQARPITALPAPPVVLEWKLPRGVTRCGRTSAIELMPDPLSPLFATLGLPSWEEATRDLLQSLGLYSGLPRRMFLTINGYAYANFSGFTAAWMIGMLPLMIFRGISWTRRARPRWEKEARPRYVRIIGQWDGRDLQTTPATQLLDGARQIVRAAASHYLTIESGIIPVAFMTEAFFTTVYNRFFRRKNEPPAPTYLLGYDSVPIRAEKSLYDLATWARTQPALLDYLTRTPSAEIAAALGSPTSSFADGEGWPEFSRRFADHLGRFGYAIYDLDFAKAVAADDPVPLVETLKFFLTGQARNPHERQTAAATAREQATEALLASRRMLRWFLRPVLLAAQRYAPLREDALADVGLGWPLLRRLFREVGRRLVEGGAIAQRDDIFWLTWDEVRAAASALDAGEPAATYHSVAAHRRETWQHQHAATPPIVLPVKGGARFFGLDFSRWMPARSEQAAGNAIHGIGTSPGRVVGVARVIHGPAEFGQMRQGDILVARITTPAWTPLFALASGVVTDVGGPLSHGSIVAREYHIPAVLGTGVATERIRSGQRITVDGDGGVVTVTPDHAAPAPEE